LDRYLAVASEDAPIPAVLVELSGDSDADIAGRELVHYVEGEQVLRSDSDVDFRAHSASQWSCNGSNDTSTKFSFDFCHSLSNGWDDYVAFCDSGTWASIIRGNFTRDWTYSVVGYCGSSYALQRHQRYKQSESKWYTEVGGDRAVDPGFYSALNWGPMNGLRRTNHFHHGDGHIRAYSAFHN
jgi:hypothetical protein